MSQGEHDEFYLEGILDDRFLLQDTDDSWKEHGLCVTEGYQVDLFFPEREERDKLDAAIGVCSGCPLRQRCYDYAIDNKIRIGVWGGTSGTHRRRVWEGKKQRLVFPAIRHDPDPPEYPLHPTVRIKSNQTDHMHKEKPAA